MLYDDIIYSHCWSSIADISVILCCWHKLITVPIYLPQILQSQVMLSCYPFDFRVEALVSRKFPTLFVYFVLIYLRVKNNTRKWSDFSPQRFFYLWLFTRLKHAKYMNWLKVNTWYNSIALWSIHFLHFCLKKHFHHFVIKSTLPQFLFPFYLYNVTDNRWIKFKQSRLNLFPLLFPIDIKNSPSSFTYWSFLLLFPTLIPSLNNPSPFPVKNFL